MDVSVIRHERLAVDVAPEGAEEDFPARDGFVYVYAVQWPIPWLPTEGEGEGVVSAGALLEP